MKTSISAADANRQFSKLLHGVRGGRSYVVTSHGEPIAEIAPIDRPKEVEISARQSLLKRLRHQPVSRISKWKRDELYEEEQ